MGTISRRGFIEATGVGLLSLGALGIVGCSSSESSGGGEWGEALPFAWALTAPMHHTAGAI